MVDGPLEYGNRYEAPAFAKKNEYGVAPPQSNDLLPQSKSAKDMKEFNVFDFQRENVTYEEKERLVNQMLDAFEEQKRDYNAKRKILEETAFLFVVNHINYQTHVENKSNFRHVIENDQSSPTLTEPNPVSPLAIPDYQVQSPSQDNAHQKDLMESIAFDANRTEKELKNLSRDQYGDKSHYSFEDLKKDVQRISTGNAIVDLATGAFEGIRDVHSNKLSDYVKAAGKGALGSASTNKSLCDKSEGQYVYVAGQRVCIPFRVTFNESKFVEAIQNLILSSSKENEQAAYDKYVSLLIPRSRSDSIDPNITKINAKYQKLLNNLFDSYISSLEDIFNNNGCPSDLDSKVRPIIRGLFPRFFQGLDDDDVGYETRKTGELETKLYGDKDDNYKANVALSQLAENMSGSGSYRFQADQESSRAIMDVISALGYSLSDIYSDPNTNTLNYQRLLSDDRGGGVMMKGQGQGQGQDQPCPIKNIVQRYHCFKRIYSIVKREIKQTQDLMSRKYRDIYKKYEAEKLSMIEAEKPVKGFRELKPRDSRFIDVMKLMGAPEMAQMLFYGGDRKLYPVGDYTPSNLYSKFGSKAFWNVFLKYSDTGNPFFGRARIDTTNLPKPDPIWEDYIKKVLVFYRFIEGSFGVQYEDPNKPTLDPTDETPLPASSANTFWVEPKGLKNPFYWHMVYKHKLLSYAKNHSDLQKSIIKNYLSLMEAIRILDEERLSQPGYKTRQFPPKIKAVADTLVGRVFQPMKAGLFDVFRRSNDEESLVLRCLQKSKLESDLQRLRELGYSGVSQFKALSDETLFNIVVQKLNYDAEKKIRFQTAVQCLSEAIDKAEAEEEQLKEATSREPEKEYPDKESDRSPLAIEGEETLKRKLDEEIANESELKEELQAETAQAAEEAEEIKRIEKKLEKETEVELASTEKIKELEDEITQLKTTMAQETIQNRNLSRKIDRHSKRSVLEFDSENERVLRERQKSLLYIQTLQNQKDNKEKQLALMRILLLENEKKSEIEAQKASLHTQKIKDQMKKIYEEMERIRNNESEAAIEKLEREHAKKVRDLESKLRTLQSQAQGKPMMSELSMDETIPLGKPQMGSGRDMRAIPIQRVRTNRRRRRKHRKRTNKKKRASQTI